MTDYELVDVLARMDKLWPRHGMNADQKAVLADKIRRCSRASAMAVLDEVFAQYGGRYPKVERIVLMCREALRSDKADQRRVERMQPERSDTPLSSSAWLDLARRVTGCGREVAMARYERASMRDAAATGSVQR
jgi:hypothetical protein